jgi:hypothetical protein
MSVERNMVTEEPTRCARCGRPKTGICSMIHWRSMWNTKFVFSEREGLGSDMGHPFVPAPPKEVR